MGVLQSRGTSVLDQGGSEEQAGMGCFGSRVQTCKTHLRRTYNGKRPLREQSKRMLTQLARVTHFTVAEVKQWYRLFLTDCPDGQLSEGQFVSFYCNHFEHGNAEIKAILARRIFHTFDRDASGCVDFREFICGMSAMLRGTPMERLKWAFCIFDLNSDGTVSKKEVINVLTFLHDIRLPQETNIDALLVAQERRDREHHIHELTDKIFHQLDRDNDGFLYLREFIEGIRSNPGLLQTVTESADSPSSSSSLTLEKQRLCQLTQGQRCEQSDSTQGMGEESGKSSCDGQPANGPMYVQSYMDREGDAAENADPEKSKTHVEYVSEF